jgi:UDP-GlcNAc3NAcA epimerase
MIITVAGTRPQFIKSDALGRAFRAAGIPEYLIHAGQHGNAEMSGIFFSEMQLPPPAYRVQVAPGTPTERTAAMMRGIEWGIDVMTATPKGMVVFGDCDASLAAALVAVKKNIPVIHIEAGVRSYNKAMPEEWNRVMIDRVAAHLFCSSESAVENLRREACTGRVHISGDVMYDTLLHYLPGVLNSAPPPNCFHPQNNEKYALLTLHRPVNADDPDRLQQIVQAVAALPVKTIWPVHPRTAKVLAAIPVPENIQVIPPAGYFCMLRLLHHCEKVITDSGGLQKEAYWMNKPCITLRSETEWVELINSGWNTLVREINTETLLAAWHTETPREHPAVYGQGHAAEKIAGKIKEAFYK